MLHVYFKRIDTPSFLRLNLRRISNLLIRSVRIDTDSDKQVFSA